MDKVLTVSHENNSTVYSGKINGEKARFTVSEDKSVMFNCGDKSYGPCQARQCGQDRTVRLSCPCDNRCSDYIYYLLEVSRQAGGA